MQELLKDYLVIEQDEVCDIKVGVKPEVKGPGKFAIWVGNGDHKHTRMCATLEQATETLKDLRKVL